MIARGKRILVDGASGYVGSHLVAFLRQAGAQVVALVRPACRAADRDFLTGLGAEVLACELGSTDVEERKRLESAFADCDWAVHLIGSIAPARHESMESLHQGQTAAFAGWCARARALGRFEKVCMVTALGACGDSKSAYLRTKYDAEKTLFSALQDKVKSCVLRPSLIVGRQVGYRDSKLVARYRTLIRTRPFVPLIGGGKNLLQPLFIGDLVEAIALSLAGDAQGTLEIGGASTVTMAQLVQYLSQIEGLKKADVAVPLSLAKLLAWLLERVQEVPTLSSDQVILAGQDMICQTNGNALAQILGREPCEWSQALDSYRRNPAEDQVYG